LGETTATVAQRKRRGETIIPLELAPVVGVLPRVTHPDAQRRPRRKREGAWRRNTFGRRAAIAVLLLGGGRVSATGAMRWRDIDLANGRFVIARDKTDAGMREVDMLPLLREILTEHKAASASTGTDHSVFVTATGRPRSRHNLRQDVIEAVVRRAEEVQAGRGGQPLPLGITPHKLRHTFASVLIAIGKDPIYVMSQLGHTDPAFTLRVYAHIMRRSVVERERLRALVEEGVLSPIPVV
jgi:integrase